MSLYVSEPTLYFITDIQKINLETYFCQEDNSKGWGSHFACESTGLDIEHCWMYTNSSAPQ